MVHHGHWKTKARCSQEPDWDGSDYKNREKQQLATIEDMTQQNAGKKNHTIKPFSNYKRGLLGKYIIQNRFKARILQWRVSEVSITDNKKPMSSKNQSCYLRLKFQIKGQTPNVTSPLQQYFVVFFVEQMPSLGSVQTHLRQKIWK